MPAPTIDPTAIINALVFSAWNGGAALALTYSVPRAGSVWLAYAPGSEPFSADYGVLNDEQASAFRAVMELYDSYVTATFNETDDLVDPGAVRAAFKTEAVAWGSAYFGAGNPNSDGRNGDIWISAQNVGSETFELGSYNFNALMHEAGHALGLRHSFEGVPPIPLELDNYRYSVMSYTHHADEFAKVFSGGPGNINVSSVRADPITPMMFDIYALQHSYGADPTTRAGNTVYEFDPNFANLQTVYDAGGIDTWNLAGHVRPSHVDLRAASFSSIDYYSKAAQIETAVAQFQCRGSGRHFHLDRQCRHRLWRDHRKCVSGRSGRFGNRK